MENFKVEDTMLNGDGPNGGVIREVSKKLIEMEPSRYNLIDATEVFDTTEEVTPEPVKEEAPQVEAKVEEPVSFGADAVQPAFEETKEEAPVEEAPKKRRRRRSTK